MAVNVLSVYQQENLIHKGNGPTVTEGWILSSNT
jgi:hypothetical protein